MIKYKDVQEMTTDAKRRGKDDLEIADAHLVLVNVIHDACQVRREEREHAVVFQRELCAQLDHLLQRLGRREEGGREDEVGIGLCRVCGGIGPFDIGKGWFARGCLGGSRG